MASARLGNKTKKTKAEWYNPVIYLFGNLVKWESSLFTCVSNLQRSGFWNTCGPYSRARPHPHPHPTPAGCPALLSSTHSPVTTDLGGDTWTWVTCGPKARGCLQWQPHLGMEGQVNSLRAALSGSSGHPLCPQRRTARGMSYTDVWALVIALAARSDLEIIRLENVYLIT